jgi:uncharacterized membrane protein
MSRQIEEEQKPDFNSIIGKVLRGGVIISFFLIALGSVLMFVENSTGYYTLGSAEQLISRHNSFLIGLAPLFQGLVAGKPYAILDLGLLVLLATPIARVFISILLFSFEKRLIYVLITITVLTVLLTATFVLGPALSR